MQNSSKKQNILIIFLLLMTLCFGNGTVTAKEPPPPGNKNSFEDSIGCAGSQVDTIIPINDSGWVSSSITSDCALGWAEDQWNLNLSSPKKVGIQVDDCCCPGDYYAIYVDGVILGTTPKPSVWGCDYYGTLSSGYFEINLSAGTHIIKVRDVSFEDHSAEEITYARMCPAGFTITGSLVSSLIGPDIDIIEDSWNFYNQTPPYRSELTTISVAMQNKGNSPATNVVVQFFKGNPDSGGTQIGVNQIIATIPVGGFATAKVDWTLSGNTENQPIYVRATVASEINPSTNSANKTISIWYIPFQHDVDAFSFENWGLELTDIKNDLLLFLDLYHPDDMLTSLLFPVIYPTWSMFLESGGHCYGMASTSSLYYQFDELKPVSTQTTYSFDKESVRSDIQNYHRTQTSYIFQQIFKSPTSPSNEYKQILTSIKTEKKPIMLLIRDEISPNTGGHAVLAYKIIDLGDEKIIFLYENNYYLGSMVEADFATINTKTDKFLYYMGSYEFTTVDAAPALLTVPDGVEVIIEKLYNWLLSKILDLGKISVVISPIINSIPFPDASAGESILLDAPIIEPLILDNYDRMIGYIDGIFINQIPGATLEQFQDFYLLVLPKDLSYTLSTKGLESGNLSLSFLIPESYEVVRNVSYFNVPVAQDSLIEVALKVDNLDWTLTNTISSDQQPDVINDVTFFKEYLPSVVKSDPCDMEYVINSGFELGATGWTRSSTNNLGLIYSSGFPSYFSPFSGVWASWLGGVNNEAASIKQVITLPTATSSASLTYKLWISSEESSCAYDFAWVEINDGLLVLHDLCSGGNTYGWVENTVDLTPYIGKQISLSFNVETDSSLISSLFLDDVSVKVQCNE